MPVRRSIVLRYRAWGSVWFTVRLNSSHNQYRSLDCCNNSSEHWNDAQVEQGEIGIQKTLSMLDSADTGVAASWQYSSEWL